MATEGNLQAPTRHALDWKGPTSTTRKSALSSWNASSTSAMAAAAA
ncbi:hypothetical protein Y695_01788 [Hydrogenophaga sp. T4]|nr:hypothetical protein Y695_01788 [Hydrogenophaga sp. T4]